MNENATTMAPQLAPLQDTEYLVQRIVDVTGLSTEQVVMRLQEENRERGVNVRKEFEDRGLTRYEWSPGLRQFYDETNAFLFETVVWNRTATKQAMRAWIDQFLERSLSRPARILTFGDGLGFDSLYFALAGHVVDYFEVSQRGVDFASQIFADFQGDVNVLTSEDQVRPHHYDAVVCLDVLEHIPDPSNVVGFLANALREDGYLLAHAPFGYLDPAVVTHLRENRRYSGDVRQLYRPHGLVPVDAALMWNPIALQKSLEVKVSVKRRLRMALGACLLWWGRYWSKPFVLGARLALGKPDWDELDGFDGK
jgi:2-polyprenyl-3-methyl-5-hydroxy-6-metoxy-1,4-benzoquinol methylase